MSTHKCGFSTSQMVKNFLSIEEVFRFQVTQSVTFSSSSRMGLKIQRLDAVKFQSCAVKFQSWNKFF